MTFSAIIGSILLSVVPQAVLNGPTTITPNNLTLLDASKSISDVPLQWQVITKVPSENYQFVFYPNNTVLFNSKISGEYNIIVIAMGQKDAISPMTTSVAFLTITAGGTPPPVPPNDPLTAAAYNFVAQFKKIYGSNYQTAVTSLQGGATLASVKATLSSNISINVSSIFTTVFAPWATQLPIPGQEPANAAQLQMQINLMNALSQAFNN